MCNSQRNEQGRLHYMDAARTFALLLGIVFHASLSFVPVFIGWAVMDVNTSELASIIVLIAHSFRMELFFLIAGFFTAHTIHKKGAATFFKSRLVRIGTPFIIGWFVLRPLLVSGWVLGSASMRGDVDYSAAIDASIADLMRLPEGLLIGTHLWFLYYLLLFSMCALLVVASWRVISRHNIAKHLDKVNQWLIHIKGYYFLIGSMTIASLWFMQHWTVDTPDKSLAINFPVFVLYSLFFLCGAFFSSSTEQLAKFTLVTKRRLFLGLVGIVGSILLAPLEMQVGHPNYIWFKASYIVCYGTMMWFLTAFTLGIAKRLVSRDNAFVSYMGQASYFVYLAHLPFVIWLQIAVSELALPWTIKLGIIVFGTVAITLFIYDLLIRPSAVGQLLTGQQHSSKLLRFVTKRSAKAHC